MKKVKTILLILPLALLIGFAPRSASAESEMFCIELYDPVCAEVQVQCVKAPCPPVRQTFSNSCKANVAGAKILYKGECKADTETSSTSTEKTKEKRKSKYKNPEDDPECKAWFDGCNSCARSYPGGPARCTLRYCPADELDSSKAECKVFFEDGAKDGPSGAPGELPGDFDKPPVKFKRPPVPMDEPGEIRPIFDVDQEAVEIIKDELNSYASDALEDKEQVNLSGNIFRAYSDGSIFLNIKAKDSFNKEIRIIGFIDPQKGRFTAYEASAGTVELQSLDGKTLGEWSLKLEPDWQEKALKGEKLWFDLNIDSSKYKNGSYILLFKNKNPSGLPENDAEFQVSIKVEHPTKKLSKKELLLKKYKGYKLVSYDKEQKTFKLEKEKKAKLLGLIPITLKEEIIVDEDTELIKDKKTPWWSWLAF